MMIRSDFSLRLLLQVLGHILLVVNEVGSSPADKTIRIGYLMSFATRAGAINVAIERAQKEGLLREYNFRCDCSLFQLQHYRKRYECAVKLQCYANCKSFIIMHDTNIAQFKGWLWVGCGRIWVYVAKGASLVLSHCGLPLLPKFLFWGLFGVPLHIRPVHRNSWIVRRSALDIQWFFCDIRN